MDLATLIGLIGAFGFVTMAMFNGGEIGIYVNLPSVLIVFAGSLFVVLVKYDFKQFFGAIRVVSKAFTFKTESPELLIERSVELAESARKNGFLALEEAEIENTFMRRAIDLLVDGFDGDTVKATLLKDIELTRERHETSIGIFRAIGEVAPAMGMIGTLIGLVGMLSNMSDPKSIGPSMAIALLTTLYGSMLANMVALPIADKLTLNMDKEMLNRHLIMDAVLAIQDGQNPRMIEGFLKNYLHEKIRTIDTVDEN